MPTGEIPRGFPFPQHFEVVRSHVGDIEAGVSHKLPSDVMVGGELLRLTTYGDLIRIDNDGVNRVAVVDPNEWK